MLKTTGSFFVSASWVNDNKGVGGGGNAGTESGRSIIKQKMYNNVTFGVEVMR